MIKKKILVRGAYGAYNFGDDALLDSVMKLILQKYKQSDIAIFGSDSSYLSMWFPDAHVVELNDLYNISCDKLVYGGGTQFYDFGRLNLYSKINILIKRPIYSIKKIMEKLSNGNPAILYNEELFLGIGLGPFVRKSTILNCVKDKINKSSFVYLRDKKSIEYANNDPKIKLATDICFSKEYPIRKINKVENIAVILRDWEHTDTQYDYDGMKVQLDSLEKKYNVTYVTFGKDSGLKSSLIGYNKKILEWDPENNKIDDFVLKLREFDFIISSRYHGIIYSVILNIPALSMPIENKLIQVTIDIPCVALYKGGNLSDYILNNSDIIYEKQIEIDAYRKKLKNSADTMLNDFLISI
ncbi:polysaccharide pyruvyl transferase family protein [Vibrio cholerae]|uniref:polysaccharide pyruvyl transferase family protein n=1 Tax=Vibrio cholerae TaxID=666 RepID=UPI002FDBC330|nr:polysaccharide pyruvyl transferase family protein [Vibrio cholerae]